MPEVAWITAYLGRTGSLEAVSATTALPELTPAMERRDASSAQRVSSVSTSLDLVISAPAEPTQVQAHANAVLARQVFTLQRGRVRVLSVLEVRCQLITATLASTAKRGNSPARAM